MHTQLRTTVVRLLIGGFLGAVIGVLIGWHFPDGRVLALAVLPFAVAGAAGGASGRMSAGGLRGLAVGGALCAALVAIEVVRFGPDRWESAPWVPLALVAVGALAAGAAGALAGAVAEALEEQPEPAAPDPDRIPEVRIRRRAGGTFSGAAGKGAV